MSRYLKSSQAPLNNALAAYAVGGLLSLSCVSVFGQRATKFWPLSADRDATEEK